MIQGILGALAALALAAAAPAVSATAAPAPDLGEGTFHGTGAWQGRDGSKGSYLVETSVKGATIRSTYRYDVQGKPQEQEVSLTLIPSADGSLSIVDGKGVAIGTAACLGQECLLTMDTGPVRLVERVRVASGRLEIFGTKTGPGFAVVYSSTLEGK